MIRTGELRTPEQGLKLETRPGRRPLCRCGHVHPGDGPCPPIDVSTFEETRVLHCPCHHFVPEGEAFNG